MNLSWIEVICIYNIESKNEICSLLRLWGEKDENHEECGNIKCFNCFYQVISGWFWTVFREVDSWAEQSHSWAEWSECGIVTRLLLTSDRLLVLKHPLLLSIIKIIESGLQVLLSQAANAVRSAGRKSDWLPCASSAFAFFSILSAHSINTWKSSSILTFVTHSCPYICSHTAAYFSHSSISDYYLPFIPSSCYM